MDKSKKYLSDILNAIGLISEFTGSCNSFNDYEKDITTRSATERQLSIIGEALNQLRKLKIDVSNGDKIIGLRNRVIHSYDAIDNAII